MTNIEIIERKGIGHPDTIADNLSENLAIKLNKIYKSKKHYNVDKVMVCAGEIKENNFINPVKIVFAGQYTKIKNINQILENTVKETLSFEIKNGLKYEIYNFLNQGSNDLNYVFNNNKANDTSFSVGHIETNNEKIVKKIGKYLDSLHTKEKNIGRDNKIMFIDDTKLKIVYIALAFLNNFKNKKDYFKIKKILENKIKNKFNISEVHINLADTIDSKFITKTGTSLEMGDSGATGRGNRRNGLITPTKPMTLEAYYGKNCTTHIGRIYQDLAIKISKKRKKDILLLNKIGGKINKPMIYEI